MKALLLIIIYSVITLIFFISCKKDPPEYKLPQDLLIKTGYECGWCSFNDSLVLSKYDLYYTASSGGCDNYHQDTLLYDSITKEELTSLMMKLDLKKYFACTLDQCGICGDGCDHWVEITANSQSHWIRYTNYSNDSALKWLEPFTDRLNEIRKRLVPAGR
jgi:hypothetical protein